MTETVSATSVVRRCNRWVPALVQHRPRLLPLVLRRPVLLVRCAGRRMCQAPLFATIVEQHCPHRSQLQARMCCRRQAQLSVVQMRILAQVRPLVQAQGARVVSVAR